MPQIQLNLLSLCQFQSKGKLVGDIFRLALRDVQDALKRAQTGSDQQGSL